VRFTFSSECKKSGKSAAILCARFLACKNFAKHVLVFLAKVFASDLTGEKRMRYLRQVCAVAMLVCALAFSAYAGNIECPGVTSQPTAAGEIPYPGITDVILVMLGLI
jgi:hypothetical protein